MNAKDCVFFSNNLRSFIAVYVVEALAFRGSFETLDALGVRRAFLEEPRWGEKNAETLLHFAARKSTLEAVPALLSAGADPRRKARLPTPNSEGETPWELAEAAEKRDVKEAILAFPDERPPTDPRPAHAAAAGIRSE
eukprot:tig00020510_g9822.t1